MLLVHDLGFPLVPAEGVQWLRDRLPRATLQTTNSFSEHGTRRPLENVLEEIEAFLFGTRLSGGSNRQVATLLVTDVVQSTEKGSRDGDLN